MDDRYLEYSFTINPLQPATDILLAELGELAFDSFVETETGLLAYIKKKDWYEGLLKDIRVLKHPDFTIEYSTKEIDQQNWNAQWEQNFEPIRIDERCLVRAPFHEAVKEVQYDLVISPKMSFGTGHQET
ncbi:MAG: 50S ribosomal protein L11 methyltransferase, partial [Flavobacteriaceae bacterium]